VEEIRMTRHVSLEELKLNHADELKKHFTDWAEKHPEVARRLAERKVLLDRDEAPLLRDLAAAGFSVESVWDLVNRKNPYKEAIPVLLNHITKPYLPVIREGIARALAVQEARYAWATLVELYENEPNICPDGSRGIVKDALGLAVAKTSTEKNIDALIMLARDQTLGDSRIMLLPNLRRSKAPLAQAALEDLSNDPYLQKEIASWRPRKAAVKKIHS
jgi:hypothetical protein